MLKVERVGALNWHTKGAGPNLSGHNTEGAGNTEENCVVVVLGEAVVHKEGTRAAINVGPGVLDLASSSEKVGNGLVVGFYQVNEVVVFNVLVSELELKHEARVGLAKNSMAVARNNLSGGKGVGNMGLDIVLGPALTIFFLEGKDEGEALLVSKSVEGSSETVHTSREREVGVGES
jgi:hypothetical protein